MQRIRLVQIRVRMTLAPKTLREPFGPSAMGWGSVKEMIGREAEMARTSRTQWLALSRRTVVIQSLACAAGAAAALAPVQEASAKMAQKAVEYQDTPKGDQECSNCSLFQEPNACTLRRR
jgi:hypothetical protein